MSDLQCPAVFVLVPADAEPDALARALAHDRVAEVRSVPGPDPTGLARHLATAWELPAPSGTELDAASYPAVLGELADTRRGETVVIVVDPALLRLVGAGGDRAGVDPVTIEVDADGYRVRVRGLTRDEPGIGRPATG